MAGDKGGAAPRPGEAPFAAHGRSIALGIVALALALRAIGTDAWWLNPDEGIYFDILTAPTSADFWEAVGWNAHPPLYYLVLRAIGTLTWDFSWYRAFSIVAGCTAVLAFWLCGLELGGRGRRGVVAGALAGLVVALSPSAILSSQIIRPYMLLLALLSLSLWLLLRYLRERGPVSLVGYTACLALALLTHYSALLAMAVFVGLALNAVLSGRLRGREAGQLLAAHVVPVAIAGGLYFAHLGQLMTSGLASNALGGWLSPYMPSTAGEIWLALLGFYGMIVGHWLAAPFALLLLAALVWAAWSRSWSIVILGAAALAIAIVLSATGQYPFGGSRHVTWLLPFLVLPVACFTAWGLTSGRRVLRVFLPACVLLIALGGPLGRSLGTDLMVPPQEERTLRRDDLSMMIGSLASLDDTGPVLMNSQTYYLLLPLYQSERATRTDADDGSFFHFIWLGRDVIVSASWDLRVGISELGAANHLYDLVGRVDDALPELALGDQREALVIFGGWHRGESTGDLGALLAYEAVVHGGWSVPGLRIFVADIAEYRRIVSGSAGITALP